MNIHKLTEFNYNLPTDRIASKPLDIRSESKLMNYKLINGTHSDDKFSDILSENINIQSSLFGKL